MKNKEKAARRPAKNNEKLTAKAKKRVLMCCVAVILLIGIGFGVFFTVDYILVDTPYDSVRLPEHIQVAKYIGAELSQSKVQSEYDKAKNELINSLSYIELINSGKIAEGHNVVISLVAYDYTGDVKGDKLSKLSFSDKEIKSIKKYDLNNLPENSELFFPELQNQIIGTSFNFNTEYYENKVPALIYTYPNDYNVTEAKGKKVYHEIEITSVSKTLIPEWNDELFASNTEKIDKFLGLKKGFTTVKAYEDYMYEQIKLNLLWNSIVDGSKVIKYPEKKIKMYTDEFDAYYNAMMEQNELTFEELLKELGTDQNGYISTRQEYAEGIVKEEMILYEIIQAEKIRISGKEYDEGLIKIAAESGETAEQVEENYGKDLAERTVIWEKVKKHILDKAVMVD